jgi:hypothetical protein
VPLLTAGHIVWQSESEWHMIEHVEPPELFPPELLGSGLLDPSSPLLGGLPELLGVVASGLNPLLLLPPNPPPLDPEEPHAINTARVAG